MQLHTYKTGFGEDEGGEWAIGIVELCKSGVTKRRALEVAHITSSTYSHVAPLSEIRWSNRCHNFSCMCTALTTSANLSFGNVLLN